MKTLSFIAGILLPMAVFGQQIRQGTPVSWSDFAPELPDIIYHVCSVPNPVEIWEEDEWVSSEKMLGFRFAVPQNVQLTPAVQGRWTTLPGGSRLWQLGIDAPGAFSIGLTFSDVNIPQGAKLFVYDPAHERLLGDFSELNLNSFGTTPLEGGKAIVEYFEPAGLASGSFQIKSVAYGYRPIAPLLEDWQTGCLQSSIPGYSFQTVGPSTVCIITDEGSRIRTGVLVNTTSPQVIPYLLTSEIPAASDPSTWLFLFNMGLTSILNDVYDAMAKQVIHGAQTVENYPGAHMALLLLNRLPKPVWKPYFSGWDLRIPEDEVIHYHVFGPGVVSASMALQSEYSQTEKIISVRDWEMGTTFTTATGSGLFLKNGSLSGVMFKGRHNCENGGTDYFSPLSVAWEGPRGLGMWLNPGGGNPPSLEGRGPDVEEVETGQAVATVTRIFPNPASDFVTWQLRPGFEAFGLSILDANGQLIQSFDVKQSVLPVNHLPQGTYFLRIWVGDIPEYHKLVIVR
jgi:lysyl endopeptidase